MKNCENNILQETPIKTFSHKFSMNENCEKSISSVMIPHISKEKNITTVRKSLFKKSSCNDIGSKKQTKNGIGIKIKFVESSNINHKSSNKYAFFYKLKEKEKNPSKTPYLDKKFWNSSFNLNKYNDNNQNDNKLNNSNLLFVDQVQSQKNKLNHLIENGNNKEIIIQNNLDEKILPNINKADNNDNTNNKSEKVEKKKVEIIDNNNRINEKKNSLQNKKERKKNSNGIIINILNKPFFCCLKS